MQTMYSIAILFALLATTNALSCRPLTCMIHCQNGFEADIQGCPICTCRRSPSVCLQPIQGYTCGLMDRLDCPITHQCHFDVNGILGQCCLKQTGSSSASPRTTNGLMAASTTTTTRTRPTTTTKPHTTTTKPRTTTTKPRTTTTRRMFKRSFSDSTDGSSSFPGTTTQY